MHGSSVRWVMLGGAVATGLGSLLPWATGPFGISVDGTSGDGTLTLVLAVVAAGFAWWAVTRRALAITGTVAGALSLAIALYALARLSSTPLVGIGIGLMVCVAGSIAMVVGGVLLVRHATSASRTVATQVALRPLVSPDGRWWWDGYRWLPMPGAPVGGYAPDPTQPAGCGPGPLGP